MRGEVSIADYFCAMYIYAEERLRIARNIRLIRELRNYNQRFVAHELRIGRSTLSTWENGAVEVTIENLERLAKIFELDDYREIIDFDPDALFEINRKKVKRKRKVNKKS